MFSTYSYIKQNPLVANALLDVFLVHHLRTILLALIRLLRIALPILMQSEAIFLTIPLYVLLLG